MFRGLLSSSVRRTVTASLTSVLTSSSSSSSPCSALTSSRAFFRDAPGATPNNSNNSGDIEDERREAARITAKEAEEEMKDRQALRKMLFGGGFATVAAVTLYFGSAWAKKRYFGEEGSHRVSVETRGKPALGGPFVLVTHDGEPVTQAKYLGTWTFFYFGFTHCPEICPVELNRMTKVVNAVREARPNQPITPLFVSCDPKRDSLESIKEYLSVFHPDFVGLVGTSKQVDNACKSYRIYYSLPSEGVSETDDYLIDHSIAIFLFDPKGQFVEFFGNRYDEKEITAKVLTYMDNLQKDPTWTNW